MVHLNVLLPLYIYPLTTTTWSPLYSTIAANPSLTFQVIIGPDLSNPLPDASYTPELEKLNSFANVETLGYVATNWTNRDITTVTKEIDVYAGWNTASGNFQVKGIFFDEAVSGLPTLTAAASTYMNTITTHAKTALGTGHNQIFLNPGTTVATSLYSIADSICVYEGSYAEFNLATLEAAVATNYRSKSSIVIYSFTGTAADQTTLATNVAAAGFNALDTTTTDNYNSWSSLWTQLCAALAATV